LPDILVADLQNVKSLDEVVNQTNVVLSTAGPFSINGLNLVDSCVRGGAHYCDITGEVSFIKKSIDTYHESAKQKGVMIVHCCGFDSIPSDINTYLVSKYINEKGSTPYDVRTFVSYKGDGSGATIQTTLIEAEKAILKRENLSPLALEDSKFVERKSRSSLFGYCNELKKWSAFFLMEAINGKIVYRSNSFLKYSKELKYTEMATYSTLFSAVYTTVVLLLSILSYVVLFPLRGLMRRFLMPKPGTGPSRKELESGFFKTTTFGNNKDKTVSARATFSYSKGDPGYLATSVMCSVAAITLAKEREQILKRNGGGILTPAVVFRETSLLDSLKKENFICEVDEYKK